MGAKRSKGSSSGSGKELISRKQNQELSLEAVLAHPAVKELSSRLETLQGMLRGLPQAIGEAVAAATAAAELRKPPAGASGPRVPMIGNEIGTEIEIHQRKLVVGGQVYDVKPVQQKERPRAIKRGDVS